MNRLPTDKRARALHWMVEGASMRSISRVEDVSMTALDKLLTDAGETCRRHHDRTVRRLPRKRVIECDENWSFVYAKSRNADTAKPWDEVGDVWTWIAIDRDTRLVVSYHLSDGRDARAATDFMMDLKPRLSAVPDICADQLKSYPIAVRRVFGRRCLLTQRKGDGTTSHIERYNLKVRMGNRRYTRKTNAFSKTFRHHTAMMHLNTVYNNFCWHHKTLRVSPAMAAGMDGTLRDIGWIVGMIDADAPRRTVFGPAKGTKYRPRKPKVETAT